MADRPFKSLGSASWIEAEAASSAKLVWVVPLATAVPHLSDHGHYRPPSLLLPPLSFPSPRTGMVDKLSLVAMRIMGATAVLGILVGLGRK
ncbi:MAG: hypothetical protein HS099_26580 [Ardenticatenaceae bacterium]|nr:hypothetical protein [Ardenticatenaceae bacterium]MBL1129150.1 hypothetical protein [Chloroflexota bacterium]